MPSPAATDAPTAAWLVQELTAARVLEPVQLRPYVQEFKATATTGDASALADFLVQAGLLTRFQADRVLGGEASKLVLGPYLFAEPLGAGSLGAVFQAVGRSDRKRYAVKVLPLRSLWNVHQAKAQVKALAALPPHPAIIPLADIDSAGGFHYLAWPFAEGETLDKASARAGRIPVAEAVRAAMGVADAMAVCHAHGVVHGLLKPGNVMVGSDGQVRILDLGVGAIMAENLADDESMLDTISTANAAMGMLDCCAPETLAVSTLRTPAGDVYSLGCVLFALLTGRLPFPSGNAVEKVLAHQTQTPPTPSGINPEVPGWLDSLVLSMLAKDPTARPAGMAAVLAVLRGGKAAPPKPKPAAPPKPAVGTETRTPTPVLPAPPRQGPGPATSPSLIDFDLPADQVTDPSAPRPPFPTAEPTDPLLALGPLPPEPVLLLAPAAKAAAKSAPFDAPPAALPAPVSFTPPATAGGVPAVERPPPPHFATSFLFKLKRKIFFWRAGGDVVQLTVFGPREASPGETIRLQVFAHRPGAFDSVCTLSRAFHQDGELLATGYVEREVRYAAELGLHMAVANAGVVRSLLGLNWLGQPQPRSFEVFVPWESPAGLSSAVLSAGLDGVLAGRVAFGIRVLPRRG